MDGVRGREALVCPRWLMLFKLPVNLNDDLTDVDSVSLLALGVDVSGPEPIRSAPHDPPKDHGLTSFSREKALGVTS